jgi:hypothetical protein
MPTPTPKKEDPAQHPRLNGFGRKMQCRNEQQHQPRRQRDTVSKFTRACRSQKRKCNARSRHGDGPDNDGCFSDGHPQRISTDRSTGRRMRYIITKAAAMKNR